MEKMKTGKKMGRTKRMRTKKGEMKLSKLAFLLALVFAMCALFAGCGSGGGADRDAAEEEAAVEEAAADEEETGTMTDKPVIEITMESGGKIAIELDPEAAPITVENFLGLVDEEFYDGLTFHRIIQGFMIQGGDPDGTGMGGADKEITGEFEQNGWDNPISHKRGVISMARSNDPDSASSQFFITNADAEFLDGGYAAFGRVLSGMDTVDEISAVKTNANDAPLEPVVMKTIRRK